MARVVIGIGNGATEQLLMSSAVVAKAVALGMDVDIYLFQGGMRAFRRGAGIHRSLGDVRETPLQSPVPDPFAPLQELRATGRVHIHACPAEDKSASPTRLRDFSPLVDDIVGLGSYVSNSEGKDVLHIYFGPCAEEHDMETRVEGPKKPALKVL